MRYQLINGAIINNLYSLWTYLGNINGSLITTNDYKSVSNSNSDWPNRIFSISDSLNSLNKVINLSQQGVLPDKLTGCESQNFEKYSELMLTLVQKNMALNLKSENIRPVIDPNIFQVKSKEDATLFASTASEAFKYRVDADIIHTISMNAPDIKMYIYLKNKVCLACGFVYFDSDNNAGLHMIGTDPTARNLGIGKSMTEKLITEALINNKEYCVLQASIMGEPIYKKLGFIPYGNLETYKILKKSKQKHQ